MRVLIAPMAAMAETSGPFSRAAALGMGLLTSGHEVAFCAAEEINYKEVQGIHNYKAPIPPLLGLPMPMAKKMLIVAQKTGVQQKKKVNSFEQVLLFAGVLNKKHFEEDVACIRTAIREYKPDVVYAEFRIAAIVAAKLEGVRVASGYSYPVQASFASAPKLSKKVRAYVRELGLPHTESVLEIFEWADIKIIPSSYGLEPIKGENTVFTGPFYQLHETQKAERNNRIIAYMGMGSISPQTVVKELTEAFLGTGYEVYIASAQLAPYKEGNITVDKRFDFSQLMPGAAVYINHGGQNSIMNGLTYGVPQIICPGNVFERIYNAESIANLHAGVVIVADCFKAENIFTTVQELEADGQVRENAFQGGRTLLQLGGVHKAIEALEELVNK